MSDLEDLAAAIRAGDRLALSRGVTLVEGTRGEDRRAAGELLALLADRAGASHRIGVSGIPGVGKSTFIDALGAHLLAQGHRVAVLAVDPSSGVSGGSILGDKTRMARLSRDDRAYVRPSPTARTLGGVTRRTREAMLLCEAAGYDVVIVETVGVGQSETAVADMVDAFVVLLLPGAGDELQGLKKGLLEVADIVAVNKADGDNVARARQAATEVASALRIARAGDSWRPPVVTISARDEQGIAGLWTLLREHRAAAERDGRYQERRRAQRLRWMWSAVEERLLDSFRADPAVAAALPRIERAVLDGKMTPTVAAEELLGRVDAGDREID